MLKLSGFYCSMLLLARAIILTALHSTSNIISYMGSLALYKPILSIFFLPKYISASDKMKARLPRTVSFVIFEKDRR